MGMDVVGRHPNNDHGSYFRNNVWWWRPLADYCITIAPDICAPCKFWYSNDRDGLDGKGAVALAEALQKEVDSGRTEAYAKRYAWEQELLPNEPCRICEGTGVRNPGPSGGAGDLREGGIRCNSCEGAGYVPAWATHYPFSTENVTEFIVFLRDSGGFSIS
jgi:hypothetical protein